MVHDNSNLMLGSFQIVCPPLETVDNGEEFFVASVVVYFCRVELARVEGDWVHFPVVVLR